MLCIAWLYTYTAGLSEFVMKKLLHLSIVTPCLTVAHIICTYRWMQTFFYTHKAHTRKHIYVPPQCYISLNQSRNCISLFNSEV